MTSVASDPFGVSGWAMLRWIVQGETDVEVLAAEARGAMRKKEAQLKEALAGKLEPAYRFLLKQGMEQVEWLRRQISELNDQLTRAMKEHVGVLPRLSKIPGVDVYAAQELLAEMGPGAAAFAAANQFASWVGVCPGSQESAGVCYSHRSAKGNRYWRRLPCQMAWAAIHAKDSFWAGWFGRLKPRIEGKGAAWAVAHRIAKVIWLILHEGVEYEEKGTAPLSAKTLQRKLRRLMKEFAKAGINPQDVRRKQLRPKGREARAWEFSRVHFVAAADNWGAKANARLAEAAHTVTTEPPLLMLAHGRDPLSLVS